MGIMRNGVARSTATGALRSSRSPAALSATLARHGELDRAVDHGAIPAGERLDALAVELADCRLGAMHACVALRKVVVDGRLAHVADQPQRLRRRIEPHAVVWGVRGPRAARQQATSAAQHILAAARRATP